MYGYRPMRERFVNDVTICKATRLDGEPCEMAVVPGSEFCYQHGGQDANPITDEMAQRAAEMYYYEDATVKEIAAELGVTQGRIHRLKNRNFSMKRVGVDRREILLRSTDMEYAGALIKVDEGEWHQILAPSGAIEEPSRQTRPRVKRRHG